MQDLRFHDFHLRGYSVSDFGTQIELDLVYDYPDAQELESRIRWRDVACYSFLHSTGAILTDICELDLAYLVRREAPFFESAARQHGLRFWESDLEGYRAALQKAGMRAWQIDSAIGFHGFVIARCVQGHNQHEPWS